MMLRTLFSDSELRALAARRFKLGAVLVELARRHQIVTSGPTLETRVVEWLVSQTQITVRPVTDGKLLEIKEGP